MRFRLPSSRAPRAASSGSAAFDAASEARARSPSFDSSRSSSVMTQSACCVVMRSTLNATVPSGFRRTIAGSMTSPVFSPNFVASSRLGLPFSGMNRRVTIATTSGWDQSPAIM
jgi:hypothetical protein